MFREGENREKGQGNRKRKKEEKMVSREGTFSLAAYGAACCGVKGQMKLSLTVSITDVQEM